MNISTKSYKYKKGWRFSVSLDYVRENRVELSCPYGHYLLRVARLPIPPPAQDYAANIQILLKFQRNYSHSMVAGGLELIS